MKKALGVATLALVAGVALILAVRTPFVNFALLLHDPPQPVPLHLRHLPNPQTLPSQHHPLIRRQRAHS